MMFSMNKFSLMPVDTIVFFIAAFILTTLVFFIIRAIIKNKNRKVIVIWLSAWIGFAIILFSAGVFGRFVDVNKVNSRQYTKKELTQDLKQLEKLIMNENPLYFTDKQEMGGKFQAAYDKIEDNMTELEFYRLINPIVTSVKCGHTNLSISEALQKNREKTAKFFPVKTTLVDNKLFTVEDDLQNGIASGDEIISINGKSSSDIIKILLENISGDSSNESKPRYIIGRHFNSRFYEFVDNSDNFNVVAVNNQGISKSLKLDARYREEFNTSAWGLHFADYADGNYYEGKINDKYAVLSIKVFMEEKDSKFSTFLDDFFLELKEKNISKLIIDIRGNFGGNPNMARALLSHMITEKMNYFHSGLPFIYNLMGYQKPVSPADTTFKGKVVVLTDGATFSTAGHFSALMKYHHLGILVGNTTGGTYVCTDSSKDTMLNHTRIRLHYSTLAYKVAVEGIPGDKGIEPDISITPTIENMLNKRDVQMEKALQVLELL